LSQAQSSRGEVDIAGSGRRASTIMRSGERRGLEEQAIIEALDDQLTRWRDRGEWQKIQCIELLFVRGEANKNVAERLDISEQTVANYKFDFIARMRTTVKKQGLSQDVFPELNA
jgi:RNA polymerase sigma-70 factor (ECF subfamily)